MNRILHWFRLEFAQRWSVVHIRPGRELTIVSTHFTEQYARSEQWRLEGRGAEHLGVMRTWHAEERIAAQ